jgi:hypothetical protein
MATLTQAPGDLSIALVLGNTFSTLGTFTLAGTPIDLTNYTINAITETSNISFTVTPVDLVNGKINLSLTATQTAGLQDGEKWYMDFLDGLGVSTILHGTIKGINK